MSICLFAKKIRATLDAGFPARKLAKRGQHFAPTPHPAFVSN
jgi:hypothetical protein